MSTIVIGYLRSGLTLVLGEVAYNNKTGWLELEQGDVGYYTPFRYAATESSARQILGEEKRRQQRVFARWSGKPTKLLNHAKEGGTFKERKCKKKVETSPAKK